MSIVRLEHGDMREVLAKLKAEGVVVQSIVTDPPYHLTSIVKRFGADGAAPVKAGKTGAYARASAGFMGKKWDGGDIAFQPETWRLCYDLLPPGGHLLAFSGTRTYHRMVCAIEDAGFEIRDTIAWLYGSGFPKSHNVSKGIDRANGDVREKVKKPNPPAYQRNAGNHRPWMDNPEHMVDSDSAASAAWDGWGTALKPALEPICVARKPLDGTVAGNVLKHGTGALNIDGCRIGTTRNVPHSHSRSASTVGAVGISGKRPAEELNADLGRWPANVVHDGSGEVVGAFPSPHGAGHAQIKSHDGQYAATSYDLSGQREVRRLGDEGSAARFFYSAKADAGDRLGSKHPTVKPVDLMRWLVRLVTPPGGTVLDPFAGSGTTGMACMAEGFDAILIEREAEYVADIRRRIAHVSGQDGALFSNTPPPAAQARPEGLRTVRRRRIGPTGLRY